MGCRDSRTSVRYNDLMPNWRKEDGTHVTKVCGLDVEVSREPGRLFKIIVGGQAVYSENSKYWRGSLKRVKEVAVKTACAKGGNKFDRWNRED